MTKIGRAKDPSAARGPVRREMGRTSCGQTDRHSHVHTGLSFYVYIQIFSLTSKTSVTAREKNLLKRKIVMSPLATSKATFMAARVKSKCKTTRCKVFNELGPVVKVQPCPMLTSKHKAKRLEWACENLKTDFPTVLWTDEACATPDGPDGWATGWVEDPVPVPVRRREVEGLCSGQPSSVTNL